MSAPSRRVRHCVPRRIRTPDQAHFAEAVVGQAASVVPVATHFDDLAAAA